MTTLILALMLAQAPTPADAALDFTDDAKLLFRVVACTGDTPLPAHIDAKVVDAHCAELTKAIEKYRRTWVDKAQPFLQQLKPPGLPKTVVYPFGGGDLISAINTYPEATEYTTMSLEHAGDPRRIRTITSAQLKASLALIRLTSKGLLTANDSKTENLMKGQRGDLPGQLSFFLIALAVHGFEPVSLRYVKLNVDGSIRPLSAQELERLEKEDAKLLHRSWVSPDFSTAFDNLELTFVKKGDAAPRTHRHFAANLNDDNFGKDLAMQAHLKAKGRVVAMTKAASYLLWRDAFSTIRTYLLEHMELMISDSTGIPPQLAKKAGFTQTAYGQFEASYLNANPQYNEAFRVLWKDAEPLPFRYGYVDKKLHNHLLVTRKAVAP